jgi:hypothetical protein
MGPETRARKKSLPPSPERRVKIKDYARTGEISDFETTDPTRLRVPRHSSRSPSVSPLVLPWSRGADRMGRGILASPM